MAARLADAVRLAQDAAVLLERGRADEALERYREGIALTQRAAAKDAALAPAAALIRDAEWGRADAALRAAPVYALWAEEPGRPELGAKLAAPNPFGPNPLRRLAAAKDGYTINLAERLMGLADEVGL